MNLILGLVTYFSLALSPALGSSLIEIVQKEFPKDCEIEKKTHFFDKAIKDSRYIIRYQVDCPGQEPKAAYIENHIVRTMREVLLVTFSKKKLDEIKTLVFNEPIEYKAPKHWLKRFYKLTSDKAKSMEEIDGLSGATLTCNAVKKGVSKVALAHEYIESKGSNE